MTAGRGRRAAPGPSLVGFVRSALAAAVGVTVLSGSLFAQDGTLSPGFGIRTLDPIVGLPPAYEPGAVAVDALGRVYLAFPQAFGGFTVVRLLATGARDVSWGVDGYLELSLPTIGGVAYDVARPVGLAVQADQKVVVGVAVGSELGMPAGRWDFGVWRLTEDGGKDHGFGVGGDQIFGISTAIDPDDLLASMYLESSGRILLAGASRYAGDDFDFAVARLTPDGDLDTAFSGDGVTTVAFDQVPGGADAAVSLAESAGGYVVLGDVLTAAGLRPALARLDVDGDLDFSWSVGGRLLLDPAPGEASINESVALLPLLGDDLLVAVDCDSSVTGTAPWLARLASDGSLVTSFGAGGSTRLAVASEALVLRAATLYPDRQRLVWVGHSEVAGSGVTRSTVGRLHTATGSGDLTFAGGRTTFDLAVGRSSSASAVALASADVVLGGGSHGIVQGGEVGNGHAALLIGSHGILGDGFEAGSAGAWSAVSP